ncbi:MAG: helix-turn-helix transcriptional regulator [Bacilli bacterium]|jgi:transcriptional regulator with XRE-family HTH domain|nr:helix-turn-helix transcriptional regulator [Candidatus Saccharimonadaceae bacterium]HOC81179.1 helix-turn-helix transcriptional regulator [Bacilli bacterium]
MLTNLKIARQKKGLKQKELGDLIDVSPKTISNYEAGVRDPDVKTLMKIASVLEVTIDYLVGLEEKTLVEQIRDRIHDLNREELADLLSDYIEVIAKIK